MNDSTRHPKSEALRLVYIVGPGHCGSTLLDMCLDAHSQVMGLGEITTLSPANPAPTDRPIWKAANGAFSDEHGRPIEEVRFQNPVRSVRQFVNGEAPTESWRAENLAAIRAIAAAAGVHWLTDSSKEWQRLFALHQAQGLETKVIYLVRDARGVVNAYRRKYGSWTRGVRRLMKLEAGALYLRERVIPAPNWLTVRYEDLASRPDSTLRKVVRFLDLPFEQAMLRPDPAEYYGIGGNRMRSRRFDGFRLDESWRRELAGLGGWAARAASVPYNVRHGYVGPRWVARTLRIIRRLTRRVSRKNA